MKERQIIFTFTFSKEKSNAAHRPTVMPLGKAYYLDYWLRTLF